MGSQNAGQRFAHSFIIVHDSNMHGPKSALN
jgi:hypothetical protein